MMWETASYFAQYASPNIVIVPTESFSPPRTEENPGLRRHSDPDPTILSSPLLNCEQNTENDISEPSQSNGEHSNDVLVSTNLSTETISSADTSDYSNNVPSKTQDAISTEVPSSHGIKELCTFKYKSYNNLVDLTGFNTLKRDGMSSTKKHKDACYNIEAKIDQDLIKTTGEEDAPQYSDNESSKRDNKSDKQSSKGSSEKRNANIERRLLPIDVEDKMKKYFRHLWRRNIDKIKDKASKEKLEKDLKCYGTRKHSNDSRGKIKEKRDSSNKSKYSSKEYYDLKTKFMAEYFSRSKSETKFNISADTKRSIKDQEENDNPVAMRRYKDFQRFIKYHNDGGSKYTPGKQYKTESIHDKNIFIKSNGTAIEKKALQRIQPIKPDLCSKVSACPDNKKRVNLMKSVVKVKKNTRKCDYENIDLRSRLSRKRTKNECLSHSKQILSNELEREDLVITVKQDAKTDSKISKLAQTVHKPKTKKYKKIKLVINIECPISADSDDSDQNLTECCTSPQDMSFLDDFDVDEIVNSLNTCNSSVENNKLNTTKNSHVIKTQENDKKQYTTEETKPAKDRLIIDSNILANKDEARNYKVLENKITVTDSDTELEDLDSKTGSIITTCKNKNERRMKSYSENYNSTLTESTIRPADTNKTDTNTKKEENFDQLFLLPTGFDKNIQEKGVKSAIKKSLKKVNKKINEKADITKGKEPKTINIKNVKKVTKEHSQKTKDRNPKSPVTGNEKFEKKFTKSLLLSTTISDIINEKKAESNIQESEDPIELSLKCMFEVTEQNASVKTDSESLNRSDRHTKQVTENIYSQNLKDTIEPSLEIMFTEFKQNADVNMDIDSANIPGKRIKKEAEILQKAEESSKVTFETINKRIKQKANNNKLDSELTIRKPIQIKRETDMYIQLSEDEVKTTQNNIQRMEVSPSNKPHRNMKVNARKNSQKTENKTKTPRQALKNDIAQEANVQITIEPQRIPSKNINEKAKYLLKSKDTIIKSHGTPFDSIAKKSNNNLDIEPPNISGKSIQDNVNVYLPKSEDKLKKSLVAVKNITGPKNDNQIDINPLYRSDNKTKEKAGRFHKPAEKYLESISNADKRNSFDMHIESSHISSQNNKEKAVKYHQTCEVDVEKSLETGNNIQHKVTTKVEPSKHFNEKEKEADIAFNKIVATTEKLLPTLKTEMNLLVQQKYSIKNGAKSNNETEQIKPPQAVENNNQKPGTINVELSKTKDSHVKSPGKDNKPKLKMETKSLTISHTKINPKQVYSCEKRTSNDIKDTDLNTQNDETKSKKVEVKSSPPLKSFVETLETWMLENLEKKYTVTSLIHNGHFSAIYKCKDAKGEIYAIKAFNKEKYKMKGKFVGRILHQLRDLAPKDKSFLLYLITSFEMQQFWCFLTDYYPKNLQQALDENQRSFHIDLVQVLSRQLVAAVNMLTDNNIIHSDIKPTHILLNSANDRLKLCGFDRTNFCDRIKILPSTGSPSYRAPEIIIGFSADYRIDVWSTALVMFEMATYSQLFPGKYNNEILYQQLCTFGSFEMEMVENSEFRHLHFIGSSFIRNMGKKGQINVVHAIQRNQNLRNEIYRSYREDWEECRTRWQVTEDLDKLETFHRLLEKMLVLDPRQRLPIEYVGASEFLHDMFNN